MKPLFLLLFFISSVLGYAQSDQEQVVLRTYNEITKKQKLTTEEKKDWHHKDIISDTIPYIFNKQLLKNKKGDTVVVAILDSSFDTNT